MRNVMRGWISYATRMGIEPEHRSTSTQERVNQVTPQKIMQQVPPSVGPADMRPPPSKLPDARKNKSSPNRGKTPSERSSTSSRSQKDACFICTRVSSYEKWSLVTCCKCKRKYHRGCHRGDIPKPCPLHWMCYLCDSDSNESMQPPTKRRKLDSPAATAPADGKIAYRPDVGRKEIPESPQNSPGVAQNGPSLRPMPFTQRPRFAPYSAVDVEQLNAKMPTQARFTQRPRFSSSILDLEEQQVIQSAISTPRAEIRRKRLWSPSFSAQSETVPGTKDKDGSSTQEYSQLIGMALHSARDNCLNTEQIYKWIIDNVPDYDLEDITWRDGVWVTLTVVEDFVRRDGNLKGPWTFCDGASTKYRPQNHLVSLASIADSSSKNVYADHAQVKQGGDTSTPLATNHGLETSDFKISENPLDQAKTNHSIRTGSEANTELPSTIEDTIDIIDLTMDDDEPSSPVTHSRSFQKLTTARSIISLLRDSPEEVVENKQQSTFAGLREPTGSRTTGIDSTRKSLTPFTDRIVENASKETIESLSGSEKWKVAQRHIKNLLGSHPKATTSTDVENASLKSPPRLARSSILVSPRPLKSAIAPTSRSPKHDFHLKGKSVEPNMSSTRVSMQIDDMRQSAPVFPGTAQQPTVEDHALKGSAPTTNDQEMPMQIDPPEEPLQPKITDPVIALPAQTPVETTNGIEARPVHSLEEPSVQEQPLDEPPSQQRLPPVEPIQQEQLCEEPPAEESPVEEPHAEEPDAEEQPTRESLIKAYTDSAAQTDSPAASPFALGTITQISLAPQAPVEVAPEAVRETAESSTQTDNLPELQAALHPQPTLPPKQLKTTQGKATKKSRPKTDKTKKPKRTREEKLEDEALKLLEKFMYPAKDDKEHIWPEHLETPYQENPNSIFFDHEAKMEEIRARPTRKQIFGKVALSRVAGRDALTRLNELKLGMQRVGEVDIYKGYTEEQIAEEKRLNEPEGHYNTVEELLGLPQQVVPHIHEQQLAFRDYAQNKSGRIGRAKHIYKIGPNAR